MRLNFRGGPGTGKSTSATWLFAELKKHHIPVELVFEFAKTWVQEGRKITFDTQIYFLGKQTHYETRVLKNGMPHIITDSPLVLCAFHAAKYVSPQLGDDMMRLIRHVDTEFPSHFIWLERGCYPYQTAGRYQTEAEARQMDVEMLTFLQAYYPPTAISMVPVGDEATLRSTALQMLT
jgi:hypothetical protein